MHSKVLGAENIIPKASHSVAINKNLMYIFGGGSKDDSANSILILEIGIYIIIKILSQKLKIIMLKKLKTILLIALLNFIIINIYLMLPLK